MKLEFSALAFVALVALGVAQPRPTRESAQEVPTCPGCEDLSALQPLETSNCDSDYGMSSSVTRNNGGCFVINEVCVMAYPCTPRFYMGAWADTFCDVLFVRQGFIGSVGVGGGRFVATNGHTEDVIYDDYTGVDCGDQIPYNVGVSVYEQNLCVGPFFHLVCAMMASGNFSCDPCS